MSSQPLVPEVSLPRFDDALCRPRPSLPWFGGGEPARIREAVGFCCRCPELDPCHRWAEQHDEAGIWGGLTQTQREVMRAALVAHRTATSGCERCLMTTAPVDVGC